MIAPDGTLGGYFEKHTRPPAFEGSDGRHYSVDFHISDDDDEVEGGLMFIRWSQDGTQPDGHLETAVLVSESDRVAVKAKLGALALAAVKDLLESLIERHADDPEW